MKRGGIAETLPWLWDGAISEKLPPHTGMISIASERKRYFRRVKVSKQCNGSYLEYSWANGKFESDREKRRCQLSTMPIFWKIINVGHKRISLRESWKKQILENPTKSRNGTCYCRSLIAGRLQGRIDKKRKKKGETWKPHLSLSRVEIGFASSFGHPKGLLNIMTISYAPFDLINPLEINAGLL